MKKNWDSFGSFLHYLWINQKKENNCKITWKWRETNIFKLNPENTSTARSGALSRSTVHIWMHETPRFIKIVSIHNQESNITRGLVKRFHPINHPRNITHGIHITQTLGYTDDGAIAPVVFSDKPRGATATKSSRNPPNLYHSNRLPTLNPNINSISPNSPWIVQIEDKHFLDLNLQST